MITTTSKVAFFRKVILNDIESQFSVELARLEADYTDRRQALGRELDEEVERRRGRLIAQVHSDAEESVGSREYAGRMALLNARQEALKSIEDKLAESVRNWLHTPQYAVRVRAALGSQPISRLIGPAELQANFPDWPYEPREQEGITAFSEGESVRFDFTLPTILERFRRRLAEAFDAEVKR